MIKSIYDNKIVYGSLHALKSTVGIIVDIDSKLTNLKKVMDEETSFTSIMDSASVSAEKFGKTLSEVLDAYSEFARQGYKEQDLINLGDAGLITSNVGELSSAKAAEYLTSAMVQFKLETKESMSVIDAWNNVSNKNATTVEKMAQGMAKAGSTAHAFGLDMNELNAIVGTVTAATKQSGTEVGNFIKSSLPRLLSAPGQDALAQAGVSFIDQKTGDMRNVLDIYKDVSVELKNMSTIEKNMVLEGLAGKFHISRMSAFLSNFSMYEKMLKESEESQGSASRENEKYMESLQARINKMKQSFEELALAMGESFITEGFIQSLQGLKSVGDGISGIVKTIGGLPVVLGTATIAVGLMSKSFRGLLGATSLLNAGFLKVGITATGMGLAVRTALASTGIGAIAIVAGMGISHLLSKMGEARESVEEFESKNRELTSSYTANKTEVSNLSAQYERLSKVISGTDYSLEDLAKFNDVRNQLAKLMPELVQGEDQYGNQLIGSSESIKSQIGLIEAQIVAQEKLDALKNKEESQKNKGELEKSIKKKEDELRSILKVDTTDVLGSNGDIKEVEKIYDRLNKKLANGEKLTMADSWNHEKAKEVIDSFKMTEAELGSLRGSYQKSIMDMIDANVTLDENTSKTTKGLINDFSLFVATSKMGSDDITSVFDNTLKALDNKEFTGVLESYGNAVEDYQEKINDGYSVEKLEDYKGKVKSSFNEVKTALVNLLPNGTSKDVINGIASSLTQSGNAAFLASVDFEKLSKTTGMTTEELKSNLASALDMSGGLGEIGDGAEDATSSLVELTTAAEKLTKVSGGQLDSLYELIGTYKVLSQIEGDSVEKSAELQSVIEQLSTAYPHLVKNKEINIAILEEEARANDILLKATDDMLKGTLTIEQAKTTTTAIQAKRRIDILKQELAAQNAIVQKFNELSKTLADNANTLAQEKLAGKAYDKAKNVQLNIDLELPNFNSAIDNLANSIDYQGRNTEATKKANKETENSIYVTDQFTLALEKLNLELEKQRAIKSKFPQHSKQYQDALKKEIKLLEQQKKLTQDQSSSLAKQISSGKIAQTGLITSNSSSSVSSSSGGGTYTGKYANEIMQASAKYGVNPFLIASIIQAESSFNPNARSGAGAQGLMQLMPGTAKELGVKNAYNPSENIMGGTKYIAQQIAKFGGDIEKALWAYNAGAGNVSKILSSGANSWTGTKAYADKILAAFNKTNQGVASASQSIADYYLNNFNVTSKFGDKESFRSSPHKGLDLANGKQGDPVKALMGGKVITATYSKSAGNWVVVQQDDGTVAKYMHMQNGLNVKAGQTVSAGQQLGKVGNTGDSTGAHLHIQIEKNGNAIDPLSYLSNSKQYAEQQQSVDEAKSTLLQLQGDVLSIEEQISQLNMALVESVTAEQDRKINSYRDDAARIDVQQGKLDELSQAWRDLEEEHTYDLGKQKEYQLQAIAYLNEQYRINQKLTSSQKAQIAEEVIDRTEALFQLQQAINDSMQSVAQSKIDELLRNITDAYDTATTRLDDINRNISLTDDESQKARYIKDQIGVMKQRQRLAVDNILKLQQEKSLMSEYPDIVKSIDAEIKKWSADSKQISIDLKNVYSELADNITDIYKDMYSQQKDIAQKAIDDELNAYKKATDERLKLINDEEDKNDYNKDLSSRQQELQDIQKQIDKLRLDDSLGGRAKVATLIKEQKDKQLELEEFLHDREVDLRKQSLEDDLTAKEDSFNKQKEEVDKYYDDLINSERNFASMREQIMQGNIGVLQSDLANFANVVHQNMATIGKSISENLLDKLNAAGISLSSLSGNGISVNTPNSIMKGILGFKSGGFTGNGEGIAMLHEQELVLNKGDTKNFLSAVELLRPITNILKNFRMPSIAPSTSTGAGSVSLTIENVTVQGGEKGGQDFMKFINNKFAARGLNTRV